MIFRGNVVDIGWDSEPDCTVHPNAPDDRLELVRDFTFWLDTESRGFTRRVYIAAPKGFRFEGSVPRALWSALTPTEPSAWAGFCIHDFFYQLCKVKLVSRVAADKTLRLALARNDVGVLIRYAVWAAVRVGGASRMKKPLSVEERREIRSILALYSPSIIKE